MISVLLHFYTFRSLGGFVSSSFFPFLSDIYTIFFLVKNSPILNTILNRRITFFFDDDNEDRSTMYMVIILNETGSVEWFFYKPHLKHNKYLDLSFKIKSRKFEIIIYVRNIFTLPIKSFNLFANHCNLRSHNSNGFRGGNEKNILTKS